MRDFSLGIFRVNGNGKTLAQPELRTTEIFRDETSFWLDTIINFQDIHLCCIIYIGIIRRLLGGTYSSSPMIE